MAAIFENGRPFVKVHFKKGPDLLTLNVDSYVLGTLIVLLLSVTTEMQ